MKKYWLVLVLTLAMAVGLLPMNALAVEPETYNGYTSVSVNDQDGLKQAIREASDSTPTVILLEGPNASYSFPLWLDDTTVSMRNKTIVFKGNGTTKMDMMKLSDNNCQHLMNATLIFDGVIVDLQPTGWYVSSYAGLGHVGKLAYRNCTISGAQFLYAAETEFTNCVFENTKDGYCVTTYGSKKVTFTDCTFDTAGKAILVGSEYTIETDITLTRCSFVDDGMYTEKDKAAVEVGDSTKKDSKFNIRIQDCTVSGFETNESTSPFWGNKDLMPHDRLIVNIDGTEVTAPYVDMSGIALTDKVWDGHPLTYTGAAKVSTYRVEILHNNASVPFTYQWYKNDGSGNYVPLATGDVPTDAGEYKLKATMVDGITVTRLLNNERSGFTVPVMITLPAYTVTWVNDDGTELEKDENVLYGTMPSYDSALPSKPNAGQLNYTFAGWTPDVSVVTGDIKYTATFTVVPAKLTIITQPQDQYVLEGEQATFTVAAQGDGLTYQWYINRKDGLGWQKIDGETSPRYTTSATKLSNDGFMYCCEVSDAYGITVESDKVTLHVAAVPSLPQTGDNSNIALWGTMLALSASCMFVILNKRRQDGTR